MKKNDFIDELAGLLQPLKQQSGQKLTLIFHAGTPKTGTTSLQVYFDKKQGKLRRKGILYPHNLEKIKNPTAPKHHWVEKNLVSENFEYFLENFKNIVSQIKGDTHTIILSSEGIYNYWWDFSDESKKVLGFLNELFDAKVWVWFREPFEFIESYYKQCIRNPQVEGNLCYGKDLSLSQMLDIEWFTEHLNYQGFVTECEALFGRGSVSAFKYKGDVVQEAMYELGLTTPYDNPTPRQNQSLNSASIALLRTINRYDVKAKDKELLIPYLKKMNGTLEGYGSQSLVDDDSKKKVLAYLSKINTNQCYV